MSNRREELRHQYEESLHQEEPSGGSEQKPDDEPDVAHRSEQQALWVDIQVRQAMRQGEFDNLPGSGKPIAGLGQVHDPDWWAKRLIEREQLTGLGPPAIMLRKEDAELSARLDRESSDGAVRRIIEDFNRRVVEARRQLQGGPPVITPTRDAEVELEAWRQRREQRREDQRRAVEASKAAASRSKRRGWRAWFSGD